MHSRLSEMTTPASRLRRTIAGLGALSVLLAAPATRAGFLPLPANGSQVNNDLANAIDPNQDAGVSDVAGGADTARKGSGPWGGFGVEGAGGRRRRRGQRPGSLGHLGGERRRSERRDDTAADLRGEGREAGRSGNGMPRRHEAGGRGRREWILLATGRTRSAEPEWSAAARQR